MTTASNEGEADRERPQWGLSPTHEILLRHHLKKLKLPTVLREHEKIARPPADAGRHASARFRARGAAEGLDHVRYLARLIERERLDRFVGQTRHWRLC